MTIDGQKYEGRSIYWAAAKGWHEGKRLIANKKNKAAAGLIPGGLILTINCFFHGHFRNKKD